MKLRRFNENNIKNTIKKLNSDEDWVDDSFEKFEIIKNELILKLNSEKLNGNTLSDLGNFIGQTIYPYMDDDLFSEDDFIGGFEHGVDSMKEPTKSKYHNF